MSKLKISIGPVELYARLLDTPAARAIRDALPFSSEARVSDSIVAFSASGAIPNGECPGGGQRAGEFILSREGMYCGIDFSKLPYVRSMETRSCPPSNVWARATGDIAALKHVIDGDPVAVEAVD